MSTVGRVVRDALTGGARAAPSIPEQLAELRRIAGARGWPVDDPDYGEAYGWITEGNPGMAARILDASPLPGREKAAAWLRSVVAVEAADEARNEDVAADLAGGFDFAGPGGGLTPGGRNLAWIAAAVVAGLLLWRR